jgi:hypothetical protein
MGKKGATPKHSAQYFGWLNNLVEGLGMEFFKVFRFSDLSPSQFLSTLGWWGDRYFHHNRH